MALPQDRYIRIISQNLDDTIIGDRSLGMMVFTKGGKWQYKTKDGKIDGEYSPTGTAVVWDKDIIVECYSLGSVARYFGTESQEYFAAARYFGYVSPSASVAKKISFAKIDAGEKLNEAFKRINKGSNDFGSFITTEVDVTCKELKDTAEANAALNYKYEFSVCTYGGEDEAGDTVSVKAVAVMSLRSYLGSIKGSALTNGYSKTPDGGTATYGVSNTLAPTIFAATDYDAINSTPCYMFKSFSGEEPTVTDESVADQFDENQINYYGLVQVNGSQRSFFQTGFNLDGEDIGIYCNEIWLKSKIATKIMDLFLSLEKVPANADGEAMIDNIVCTVAGQGLSNGVILLNKTLDSTQKEKIRQLTGNKDAWFTVENAGYTTSVEIRREGSKYIAYYKLVYAKGDSIRKVEGSHTLI